LEKRLAAKLVESAPAILVDNVNGVALKSAMLASVITESPAEIRILGKTQMTKLNSTALFFVTGNGLRISTWRGDLSKFVSTPGRLACGRSDHLALGASRCELGARQTARRI
jgi:hypothetical protein